MIKKPVIRIPENFYSKVFENLRGAVFVADPETGLIIETNGAAEALLGKSREEIVGLHQMGLHPPEESERYRGIFEEHIGDEGGLETRAEVVRKDGSRVPVVIRASLASIDGRRFVIGLFEDLRELEEAEGRYRDSEAIFEAMAEATDAAILIYQDTVIKYVNRAGRELTGYTAEEAARMNFWDLVHPDDREMVKQRGLARQRGEDVPANYEFKILTKDGKTRWVDLSAGTVEYKGAPAGIVTAFDITDRVRAEKKLADRNRQLVACLSSATAMGTYTLLKDAARSICEAAVEAFDARMVWIGLIVADSTEVKVLASAGYDEGYTKVVQVHWDESSRAQGPVGKAVKTRRPCVMKVSDPFFSPWREEAEKRGFDVVCALPLLSEEEVRGAIAVYGDERMIFDQEMLDTLEIFARQAAVTVVNDSLYREAVETILDLEETNRALTAADAELMEKIAALEDSERRFYDVALNSGDIIWEVDSELILTYLGGSYEELSGYKPEEKLGSPLLDLIDPVDLQRNEPIVSALIEDPVSFGPLIVHMRNRQRELLTIEARGVPVWSPDKQFMGFRGTATNVTEREAAHTALLASEKRYRELVNSLQEGVGIVDQDENIVLANPAFCQILGVERAAVEGENLSSFMSPEEFQRVKEQTARRARGAMGDYELTIRRPDGEERTVRLKVTPRFDEKQRYIGAAGIVSDVTEDSGDR